MCVSVLFVLIRVHSWPNITRSRLALRADHQIFRKAPFLVHPLLFHAEPGGARHGFDLLQVELVAGFGADGFLRREIHNQARVANAHDLMDARAEVHFDAPRRLIVADRVFELPQVEIGIEFPVEPPQKVQIEGRGDAWGSS